MLTEQELEWLKDTVDVKSNGHPINQPETQRAPLAPPKMLVKDGPYKYYHLIVKQGLTQ